MTAKPTLIEGEKGIVDILTESDRAAQRLYDEHDQLKASYPDQWVAVSKDGLVAHHEDLNGIIAGLEKVGYESSQVAVEFLDTEPRMMLLRS